MGVGIPHIGAADADGAYPAYFTAFSQAAGALHGLRGKEQPVCPVNEPPVRIAFSEKPGGRLPLNCLNARPDASPARRAPDTLRRGDADGCNPPAVPPPLRTAELTRRPRKACWDLRAWTRISSLLPLIGWTRRPRSVALPEFGGRGEGRSLSPAIL